MVEEKRHEYFSPLERETNYLIDLLTQINKEYSEIIKNKLMNKKNRLAMLTFKADVLALFKFLRAKMLKSKIEIEGKKKYEGVVGLGDYYEKHPSRFSDENAIDLYALLEEFIEDEGLIKNVPFFI